MGAHAELLAQVQSHPGPATNEEAEGMPRSYLNLPKQFVKDARDIFADIFAEEDPDDDEETVVEGGVVDVCLGRPDSHPEPESNAPACNPQRCITHSDQRPTRSPRPRSLLAGFLLCTSSKSGHRKFVIEG